MRSGFVVIARLLTPAAVALLLNACTVILGAKPVMPVSQGMTFYPAAHTPAPTVLMVPGCGGAPNPPPTPAQMPLIAKLNAAGFNAVLLNYTEITGVDTACFGEIKPKILFKIMLDALHYTASQPMVDRHRIALLGWSLGASAVLTVAQKLKPDDPVQIAAVAAYYPGCYKGLKLSTYPTLLLLGLADNVVNPHDCLALAAKSPQTPLEVKTYPGAQHRFDDPHLKKEEKFHFLWRTFTARYDPTAAADAQKTLLQFLKKYDGWLLDGPRIRAK